ncbi:MAG: Dabb family protein [Flammeovirgaceae bacterium]|nr:Dabb family protein [Flammeovirgaceae bacterium]
MKKINLQPVLIALGFIFLISAFSIKTMEKDSNSEENITAYMKPQKLLRHVVLMKFKDETTEKQLKVITDSFDELPSKIKEIHDFEWGTDVSPENLQQGFTHCFFVTFKDDKARDIYLPHPAHKAFVDLASPSIDKVCVVDYFTKN